MTLHRTKKRRRLFVVWIATVAISGATVLARTLIHSEETLFLGVDVASGLTGTSYIAATAMCATTIRWFWRARKKATLITVLELRKRARMPH